MLVLLVLGFFVSVDALSPGEKARFSVQDREYLLLPQTKTYKEAWDFCEKNNMHLAILKSHKERTELDKKIVDVIRPNIPKGYWRSYWVGAVGPHAVNGKESDFGKVYLIKSLQLWLKRTTEKAYVLCQKECRLPPPKPGTQRFHCRQSYRSGETASFFCRSGYHLTTDRSLRCTDNSWKGKTPSCVNQEAPPCPKLKAPKNGAIYEDTEHITHHVGTSLSFYCHGGFKLNGSSETWCGINSEWTHRVPTCTKQTCSKLQRPVNGLISVEQGDGESHGSVVNFSCNKGYTLHGERSLYCDYTGAWHVQPPTCEETSCPEFEFPNGQYLASKKNKPNSIVSFQCENKYELRGAKVVTCGFNGVWNPELPKCVYNQCPPFPVLRSAIVRKSNGNKRGSIAHVSCIGSTRLVGSSILLCNKHSQWSEDIPKCLRDCETTVTEVEACTRPIYNESLTLLCRGEACQDVTHQHVLSWSISSKDRFGYNGHASLGQEILHPDNGSMLLNSQFKEAESKWSYDLILPVVDKYVKGTYTCLAGHSQKSIRIKPINPAKWGSVTCSKHKLILKGRKAKQVTYVSVNYNNQRHDIQLNQQTKAYKLPETFPIKEAYVVFVCFCHNKHFPKGCVKQEVTCS